MARFNYPSLKALRAESSELMLLLEAEGFGYKADEQEKIEEMNRRLEQQQIEQQEEYHYG